jgi:hypothetical protein
MGQKIVPGVLGKTKTVPKVGNLPGAKVPKVESPPRAKAWTFALGHWQQIKHFGLVCEKVNEKWFVSLLEKLRDLSKLSIDDVSNNPSPLWRFHRIDWSSKNIPIQESDLDWVSDAYLDSSSPEKIEYYQFQITKATGRIIGFLDHKNVFQIVLLDPMHNAQPSKYNGYAINKTDKQVSTYQDLQSKLILIQSKIDKHCPAHTCEVLKLTGEVHSAHEGGKHIFVNDVVSEEIEQMCREHNYADIFDLLVDALDALKQQKTLDNSPLNAS